MKPGGQWEVQIFDLLLIVLVFFAGSVVLLTAIEGTGLRTHPQAIGSLVGSLIGLVSVAIAGYLAARTAIKSKEQEHALSQEREISTRNHERIAIARALRGEIESLRSHFDGARKVVEGFTGADKPPVSVLTAGRHGRSAVEVDVRIFEEYIAHLGQLEKAAEAVTSFYTGLEIAKHWTRVLDKLTINDVRAALDLQAELMKRRLQELVTTADTALRALETESTR